MHFLWTLLGVCSGMRFHRLALHWTAADALKYLLKFALLLTLVGTPFLVRNTMRSADMLLERIDGDKILPECYIEHGHARTPLSEPYCRRFQDFAFIIDTTNTTPLVATGATASITITGNSLQFWTQNRPHPQTIPLNLFPDGRLNSDYFRNLLSELIPWMSVVTAVMVFAGFFCGAMLQVLVFSGIAAFVEQGIEPGYRFEQLFSFGVLAITPAAIAALVYTAFGVALDYLSLVYFLAFAFYFTGSTTVCRILLLPPSARAEDDDS